MTPLVTTHEPPSEGFRPRVDDLGKLMYKFLQKGSTSALNSQVRNT